MGEGGNRPPDGVTSGRGRGRWPTGSVAAAAAEVLRRAGGPLTLDELAAGLSGERAPVEGLRRRLPGALRQNATVCRVGTSTYDLVERRLAGACLRHVLTPAEARYGLLLAEPDLDDLTCWWERPATDRGRAVPWTDDGGASGSARITHRTGPQPARARTAPGYGDRVYRVLSGLTDWLRAAGARAGDEVCFRAEPPDARRFRLSVAARGADAVALREADAALAETAAAIVQAAGGMLTPGDLLRRLVGRIDLRGAVGFHLPVFVLGQDRRFVFDGVFYALRGRAEEMAGHPIASPYPRADEYPPDWPARDPSAEMKRQVMSALPPAARALLERQGDDGARLWAELGGAEPELRARLAEDRTLVWQLLQDRSRLLDPDGEGRGDGARPRRGKVIRGPWRGSGPGGV